MFKKSKNLTLSQKVTVAFVLISVILIVFLVGIFGQNALYKKRYDSLNVLSLQRAAFQKRQIDLQNDLSQILNDTSLGIANGLLQQYVGHLTELQKLLVGQDLFGEQAFQLEIQINDLKRLLNRNDFNSNEFLYLRQVQIDIFELFAALDQLILQNLEQQRLLLTQDEERSLIASVVLLVVCLAFIIYLMIRTTRQIQQTITQLIEFTENVSHGQINRRLDTKGNSDLGFLISAFNNMTENLSMASDILDERDQLKDEFVSVVSHEIRTPIAILQRVIENMRSGVAGAMTPEQVNLIKIAENNVLRLSHLIKNLLDMARLESRQMKMNPTTINLREILQDLHFGFAELAGKDNLTVAIKADATLPNNYADSELIIQVITNLFNNALRFAKSQITIEAQVQTLRGKPAIQVSLKDDGPGISAENQKKLFQKFVQINRQSTGQGYKGTGLGLAICKQIVEQHGGTIGVLSQVAKGSEFYFVLPQN